VFGDPAVKKIQELEFHLDTWDDEKLIMIRKGTTFLKGRVFTYEGVVKKVVIYALVDEAYDDKERVMIKLVTGEEKISDEWTWFDTIIIDGVAHHLFYLQGSWG
jgi:hypothetical protein